MRKQNGISLWVYIAAVFSMIFWGFSFVGTKIVFRYYEPITTIFLRLVLATVFLFVILKILGLLKKIKKEDWRLLFFSAMFNPFLYFIGENFGLKHTTATVASIIIATIPVFTPVFAYIFLKEKLTIYNYLGILLSFTGIFVMLSGDSFGHEASVFGIGMMFFAVFSAVGYSVMVKKLVTKYSPVNIIAYQNLIGLVLFLPVFLIFELNHFLEVKPGWDGITALIILAIFASSLAFILFIYAVKYLGVSKANVYSNLIPVLTGIFSLIILSEAFTIRKIIGIFIILIGVFISQIRFRRVRKKLN
ncbi:DMT family transporter [Bacteroidota bacterium]